MTRRARLHPTKTPVIKKKDARRPASPARSGGVLLKPNEKHLNITNFKISVDVFSKSRAHLT